MLPRWPGARSAAALPQIDGVDKAAVPGLAQAVMGQNNVIEIKVEPPDFEKVLKNFYASKAARKA